jgi:hypothetical protein
MKSAARRLSFAYLTASPFSGSTLFSFLVNSHPQIATVGEMTGPIASQDPDNYRCSCGERIRDCFFWKQVAAQMVTRGFVFDPGRFDTRMRLGSRPYSRRILSGPLPGRRLEDLRDGLVEMLPGPRKRLRYLIDRNIALAASVLEVSRKPVFFDASKNPMAIRHLHRRNDIDLRVVHLVRDVRGAGLSKRKNRSQSDWHRAVSAWVRMNQVIEGQLRRLADDRWIRIRYEDLCRSPAATLNRFFEFCDLQPHALPTDFGSAEHHVVGNRMRLTNAGQIRLDETWRGTLTPNELAIASKLAGPLHMRYGYPPISDTDLAA